MRPLTLRRCGIYEIEDLRFRTSDLIASIYRNGLNFTSSTFCPTLETFECEMWPCFSDEALETMIIRRTSPKFQGSILRRVAVDFSQYPGRQMTLDLRGSLDNVVDGFFELELKYFAKEPDMKVSAWSGA